MFTVHDIQVFLHHAVCYDPWHLGSTPAYRASVERLLWLGLFRTKCHPEELTEKGEGFLANLKNTHILKGGE